MTPRLDEYRWMMDESHRCSHPKPQIVVLGCPQFGIKEPMLIESGFGYEQRTAVQCVLGRYEIPEIFRICMGQMDLDRIAAIV
jgi:hypothetical protein